MRECSKPADDGFDADIVRQPGDTGAKGVLEGKRDRWAPGNRKGRTLGVAAHPIRAAQRNPRAVPRPRHAKARSFRDVSDIDDRKIARTRRADNCLTARVGGRRGKGRGNRKRLWIKVAGVE